MKLQDTFSKARKLLYTMLLALGSQHTQGADHLLISEVLIDAPGSAAIENNETSAEFVEIYNPTSSIINLGNYILTDYPTYYNLPAGGFVYGENSFDYMLQFPATASLAPGQIE